MSLALAAPEDPTSPTSRREVLEAMTPGQVTLDQLRAEIPASLGYEIGLVGIEESGASTVVSVGRHERLSTFRDSEAYEIEVDDTGAARVFSIDDDGARTSPGVPVTPTVECRMRFTDDVLVDNGCRDQPALADRPRPEPAPPKPERDWVQYDRNGKGTYSLGVAMASIGLTLQVVGTLADSPVLVRPGVPLELVGGPLMAGGALRSRRGLAKLGDGPSGAAGGTAWVLWAGGLGLTTARVIDDTNSRTLGFAASVCRLGTLFASMAQQGANRRARRRLGIASATSGRTGGYRVALSPWRAGPTQGLSLTLTER
ncbi:MAG: hypothetical protein AAF211_07120 [Myxococcota bacterium]